MINGLRRLNRDTVIDMDGEKKNIDINIINKNCYNIDKCGIKTYDGMSFVLISILDPDVFKALYKINKDKTIFTKDNNTLCTSLLYFMKSQDYGKEICRFPYRKGIGVVITGEDDIEILSTSKVNATSNHAKQPTIILRKNQNRLDNINMLFGRKTYQLPGHPIETQIVFAKHQINSDKKTIAWTSFLSGLVKAGFNVTNANIEYCLSIYNSMVPYDLQYKTHDMEKRKFLIGRDQRGIFFYCKQGYHCDNTKKYLDEKIRIGNNELLITTKDPNKNRVKVSSILCYKDNYTENEINAICNVSKNVLKNDSLIMIYKDKIGRMTTDEFRQFCINNNMIIKNNFFNNVPHNINNQNQKVNNNNFPNIFNNVPHNINNNIHNQHQKVNNNNFPNF